MNAPTVRLGSFTITTIDHVHVQYIKLSTHLKTKQFQNCFVSAKQNASSLIFFLC